jgi:septal ring factor EnvC (AmiA/AmiB activator)
VPSGLLNPSVAATPKPAATKRAPAKHRSISTDKRHSQLKTQLDEQQKQLQETQDQVARDRAELEGSINSTHDELNGSIAKTHEELVALEKRAERSYFEFDLSKSKQFQRFGPITLSLPQSRHQTQELRPGDDCRRQ